MLRAACVVGVSLITIGLLQAEVDPPSRVARLSYLSGAVSFQPAGIDDWVEAPLNRPLTTADRLWLDRGSRAELHLGGTAVRAGGNTAFSFLNLDDHMVQIQLSQGSLTVHVRRLDEDDAFEIDTPNLAFSLLRPGQYRVDVNPNGDATILTVRSGEAEGTGGGQAFPVHPRQQVRVSGFDSITYDFNDAPPPDGWDQWCLSRDRREDQSASARYVSREVIGYQDLDDYGTWREAPGYGMVWYPRAVATGWAPYRYGHWTWIDPWGWTWVDEAPWGFAPFHYGRWIYAVGNWGWVPGPVAVRPVYAPALVAWVGGAHFSLSISAGGSRAGMAWFPLGPGDAYVPPVRTSARYFTSVNVSNTNVSNQTITRIYNTTVVNNHTTIVNNNITEIKYVNRNAPGAVTAVPQEAFVRSRPVAQAAVAVPANLPAGPVSYSAPVAPTRQSVLGPNAAAAATARPPAAVVNRPVVAKAPPPPQPLPFAAKQQVLQANPGRPVTLEAAQQLQPKVAPEARPVVRLAPPVRAAQTGQSAVRMPQTAQPATAPNAAPAAPLPQAAPAQLAQPAPRPPEPRLAQPTPAPNAQPVPRLPQAAPAQLAQPAPAPQERRPAQPAPAPNAQPAPRLPQAAPAQLAQPAPPPQERRPVQPTPAPNAQPAPHLPQAAPAQLAQPARPPQERRLAQPTPAPNAQPAPHLPPPAPAQLAQPAPAPQERRRTQPTPAPNAQPVPRLPQAAPAQLAQPAQAPQERRPVQPTPAPNAQPAPHLPPPAPAQLAHPVTPQPQPRAAEPRPERPQPKPAEARAPEKKPEQHKSETKEEKREKQ